MAILRERAMCFQETRKVRRPYAAESPWRRRLFNMPSRHHRGAGEANTFFPPTSSTCPSDERGIEEVRRKKSADGVERDNDDESHFSPSLPIVCRC